MQRKFKFVQQSRNLLLAIFLIFTIGNAYGQVGAVIWEENFNTLDNWISETGNGSWGWGNGELEFYKPANAVISEIPGEPGNKALHITAKEETGPDIVDQWGNPLNYTSARINTKSKISVKYGVIETRVRVPDLDLGGWPAVWLLGTANYAWPRNGEIDMMEMGHKKAFRDLHDGHNGGNGQNNSTVNQIVEPMQFSFRKMPLHPKIHPAQQALHGIRMIIFAGLTTIIIHH